MAADGTVMTSGLGTQGMTEDSRAFVRAGPSAASEMAERPRPASEKYAQAR